MMETYKQIDLNDYTQIGEGGNGKTYVNPCRPRRNPQGEQCPYKHLGGRET